MANNIRKTIVLLTVVALGFLIAIPIADAQATKRKRSRSTTSRKTSVPNRTGKVQSLDAQALAFYMDFWLKHYTRCGEYYIGRTDYLTYCDPHLPLGTCTPGAVEQIKGYIVLKRVDLTEADRLNGFEYLAEPWLNWSLKRIRDESGNWRPWEARKNIMYYNPPVFSIEPRNSLSLNSEHIRKMNGQWEVNLGVENEWVQEQWLKYPPLPCSVLQE